MQAWREGCRRGSPESSASQGCWPAQTGVRRGTRRSRVLTAAVKQTSGLHNTRAARSGQRPGFSGWRHHSVMVGWRCTSLHTVTTRRMYPTQRDLPGARGLMADQLGSRGGRGHPSEPLRGPRRHGGRAPAPASRQHLCSYRSPHELLGRNHTESRRPRGRNCSVPEFSPTARMRWEGKFPERSPGGRSQETRLPGGRGASVQAAVEGFPLGKVCDPVRDDGALRNDGGGEGEGKCGGGEGGGEAGGGQWGKKKRNMYYYL